MHSEAKALVCIGGGGHARVVMDALGTCPMWHLVGYTDPQPPRKQLAVAAYLGDDEVLLRLQQESVEYAVLGVGSVGDWAKRRRIVDRVSHFGFKWGTVIHARAYCAAEVSLGEGTVMFAQAVINSSAFLGRHTIINTSAVVEHDCRLGDWVHVAPGACVGGGVGIGEGTHIGLGSRVREGVLIGCNVLVGAGAVVVDDVPNNVIVAGCPARILRSKAAEG